MVIIAHDCRRHEIVETFTSERGLKNAVLIQILKMEHKGKHWLEQSLFRVAFVYTKIRQTQIVIPSTMSLSQSLHAG